MSRETTFTADDVAAAFRAGLELGRRGERPTGDGGFAERFLEERREAYAEGYVDCVEVVTEMRREKVTEDQVRDILDGAPAPTGLDPETIAAARRIARRLNGRPR